MKRVLLDQFLFNPAFMALRLTFLWSLESVGGGGSGTTLLENPSSLVLQLVGMFPRIMPPTWALWIPALFINFSYLPLKYQLLYTNMVSLVWNVIFSYAEAKRGKPMQEVDEIIVPGPA
eukprot:CAMPEP_0198140948 /NCGR_PEP_ID=MMETSP1443-20131203/4028_1 /TAXON_ID=186043 /ORGANISM="Entomoneis sp., Strain CCMP2396" /LENGTH=118 /DNA_ID=CAMNT_0043803531 /DNA_START=445 /DNA_END=801 /DNA_ORIENTATION=+